jgi:hypothetical protein
MVAVNCATRRTAINTPLEGKSEILITEADGACTGSCHCATDISNVLYYRHQNNTCGSSVYM